MNDTGALNISTLAAYSSTDAALIADNSAGGDVTTFTLGIAAGKLDADSGEGLGLNTLTANIVLAAVNSTNSGTYGIELNDVAGSLAVNGGTITAPAADAVSLIGVSADATFTGLTIGTPASNGFYVLDPVGGAVTTIDATVTGAASAGIYADTSGGTADGVVNVTGGDYSSTGFGLLGQASGGGALTFNVTGASFSGGADGISVNGSGGVIMVNGFGGVTVDGPGGGAIFQSVAFDVAAPGGSLTIGSAATRVTGTGLGLAGVTGTLTLSSVDIYSDGGAALVVDNTGHAAGDFTLSTSGGTLDSDGGAGLVLDPVTVDLTLDAVNSANSGTDGITLSDVAGSLTINGGTISSPANNGVTLTDVSAGVTIDGLTISSPGVDGIDILDPQGGALTTVNATVTAPSGYGIFFNTSSSTDDGALLVTSGQYQANGDGLGVFNDGDGTVTLGITGGTFAGENYAVEVSACGCTPITINAFEGFTVDASNIASWGVYIEEADFNVPAAGAAIVIGTAADRVLGVGLWLVDVTGTLSLSKVTIFSDGGPALGVHNSGVPGDFTYGIQGGSLDTINDGAIDFVTLTADVTLDTVTVDDYSSSDDGLYIRNVAGTIGVTDAVSILGAGDDAVDIGFSSANVTFSGPLTLTDSWDDGVDFNANSGTIRFDNTVTITTPGDEGIILEDDTGSVTFGDVSIDTPASGGFSAGIHFRGSNAAVTFGNVDITGVDTDTAGVNFAGATLTGDVTFATLDISGTGASGADGIVVQDLITSHNVTISNSSTMIGLEIGVDLAGAVMTGMFRYGDGSNIDANGAASTIDAVTPIDIAGIDTAHGSYNFLDVNLVGDTSGLTGGFTPYFVDAVTDGIDDGTAAHPGSLAGAELSGSNLIILVDTQAGSGAADTLDAAGSNGDDTLTLGSGARLVSFLNGDTISVNASFATNVYTFGLITDPVENPNPGTGAPNLTTSAAGADVVTLGNNNVIDGVVITATAGARYGVAGTDIQNVTIQNSTITGTGSAVYVNDSANHTSSILISGNTLSTATNKPAAQILAHGASTDARLALTDNILSSNGSVGAYISGDDGVGGRRLTVTDLSGNTVTNTAGASAGFEFLSVVFDSDADTVAFDEVSGGNTLIGTTSARVQGDGLSLDNVTGILSFDELDIAGNNGTGLLVTNSAANDFTLNIAASTIDVTNGTAIDIDPLTLNATFGSISATGAAYGIHLVDVASTSGIDFSGAVDVTGATTAGVSIDGSTGAVTFDGAVTIDNSTSVGDGVNMGGTGSLSFTGGLGITTTTGTGFDVVAGTVVVSGTGNTIDATSGSGLFVVNATVGAAGVRFDSITSGGGIGVSLIGDVLDGSVDIRGLTATGSDGAYFSSLSGSGEVDLTGTIDIDVASYGLEFLNSFGAINIANTAGSVLTIDNSSYGIAFSGVGTGTVNIAVAAGAASIGATGDLSGAAVFAVGNTGGTLNYGGTIKMVSGSVLSASGGDQATATLSGAITSTTSGTAFDFVNADGTYTISGAVTQSVGKGVDVAAASSGAITFSNASKTFSTGANTAISMAGTGSLSFTGGVGSHHHELDGHRFSAIASSAGTVQ